MLDLDPDPDQMDTNPKHCFFLLIPLPTQGGHEDAGGPTLSLHQHNSSALAHSLANLHCTPGNKGVYEKQGRRAR